MYSDFKRENRITLFGHEDAGKEKENRLAEYYFKTNQYEDVCSNIDFQIITGEKGTGKSALLKVAYLAYQNNGDVAIWVRMDDLSEIYSSLLSEDSLFKLKTLWKKAISKLVVMRLVGNLPVGANEDYARAINWAYETGYSRRDFVTRAADLLKPLYSSYIDIDLKTDDEVSETKVLNRLIERKCIRLFFDDFDIDWKGNAQDIIKFTSLLQSLSDLTSDMDGLSVRITLRSDVYDIIRNQEFSDKYESSIIQCKWNNQQVLRILAKRLCTYYHLPFDEENTRDERTLQYNVQKYLKVVFEERFPEGSPMWSNAPIDRVIYTLIRRRPRDMVKLCHNVAEYAYNNNIDKINSTCFIAILDSYSQERLRDIVNEYRLVMPELEALLLRMAPTQAERRDKKSKRYVYTTDQLYTKINNIMQNVVIKIHNDKFDNTQKADVHDVAHFLYRIGFITGRKDGGKVKRVYFDEAPYLLKKNVGDNGFAWEIHPAYRAALAKGINDSWESTLSDELVEV